MKALIIDDSLTMRKILAREVEKIGCHDIHEARNGQEGLAMLSQETDWDFVLLDWNMPLMNGLEFIKAARANPSAKKVPIIMVTTENSDEHKKMSLDAGATGFITKPFTSEDLLAALKGKHQG